MVRSWKRLTAGAFAIALAAAVVGCGNAFVKEEKLAETGASLKGTITFEGKPMQFAMIRVKGASKESQGKIGGDGTYLVENCPIGPIKIGINTEASKGEHQTAMRNGGDYTGPDGKGKKRVLVEYIDLPKRYFEPDTSNISFEIKSGVNEYNIELKK